MCDRTGGIKCSLADATYRVDVASGGGEEDFGDWSFGQIGQGNGVLEDGNVQAKGEFENERAGDAAEATTAEGWGFEAAVANDENVAASAFA